MNRRQKKQLYRIVACALLLCAAYFADRMFAFAWYIKLLVYLVPYLTVGAGVLLKAVKNIFRGQVFDENFLMAIATIGALILGEYPEATFVMLFYQVGELFESIAVGKSRRSISQLMDIKPDHANIEIDGQLKMVSPEDVHIGDIITVKPGEKIPAGWYYFKRKQRFEYRGPYRRGCSAGCSGRGRSNQRLCKYQRFASNSGGKRIW